MIEIIPSKWMRNYLKQQGHELTDSQKATMIWHADAPWTRKLDSLQELAAKTQDGDLRRQIEERVSFEKEEFDKFRQDPQGQCVYVVENNNRWIYGVFSDYDTAHKQALQCIRRYTDSEREYYTLKKYSITTPDGYAKDPEQCDKVLGEVELDLNGEIDCFLPHCPGSDFPEEEEAERFEEQFFMFPCGLRYGSVKILGGIRNFGPYGVVDTTPERWENVYCRVACDYTDVQVVVYCLLEDGRWSHQHINPLFLEPEALPDAGDDARQRALSDATEALIAYFEAETKENGRQVVRTAKKYARLCAKENGPNIKTIKDVFN